MALSRGMIDDNKVLSRRWFEAHGIGKRKMRIKRYLD